MFTIRFCECGPRIRDEKLIGIKPQPPVLIGQFLVVSIINN